MKEAYYQCRFFKLRGVYSAIWGEALCFFIAPSDTVLVFLNQTEGEIGGQGCILSTFSFGGIYLDRYVHKRVPLARC